MKTTLAALLLLPTAVHAQSAPPPCTGPELSITFDYENGQFDAAGHSGTLLVLRNFSDHACTVPGRPGLQFTDDAGKALAFNLQVPPGMHPGPVIVPVVLPGGGAEATAPLRWVNGDPFNAHHCIDTATLHLSLQAGTTLSVPIRIHTCSAANQPATYQLAFLRRDPTGKP